MQIKIIFCLKVEKNYVFIFEKNSFILLIILNNFFYILKIKKNLLFLGQLNK